MLWNQHATCCLLLLFLIGSCTPGKMTQYATGLKVYKEFDEARFFDTTGKAPSHFRPVKIDLFYPSTDKPKGSALTYGDILDMYELRLNYTTPIDSCRKSSLMLAGAISEYLQLDSASQILNFRTAIYQDLSLPTMKMPLIIYAAGMNGSTWDHPFLFDSLARAGYAVAVISSVGKFPGYMSEAVDMEEQVQDLLFTKQRMKGLPFVDSNRIGFLSWSLGGTAITKAAMVSNDIRCLLSFDGTEIHYYNNDTAWNTKYNAIKQLPPNKPEAITVPYLYLSSEHPKGYDSVDVLPAYISSKQKYFLQFNKGLHEDFSSLTTIAYKLHSKHGSIDSSRIKAINKLTLTFFDQYLKEESQTNVKDLIGQMIKENPVKYKAAFPTAMP